MNKDFEEDPPGRKIKPRVGAENDLKYLKGIYDKYAISYEEEWHWNVESRMIGKKIEKFVDSIEDCPVIFVSVATHGGRGGTLQMSDCKTVTVEEVIQPFEQLMGIPKVFIFQACRGGEVEELYSDAIANQVTTYATKKSDIIVVYSTSDKFQAFRSSNGEGSWFLEVLHACVTAKAYRELHFIEILTVCTNLIINYCHKEPDKIQRKANLEKVVATQTPTYHSTLRKFLRFPKLKKEADNSKFTQLSRLAVCKGWDMYLIPRYRSEVLEHLYCSYFSYFAI